MPDPATEYAAVRRGVGLVDRSDLGIVEVTGRDRATFLHAMLSNDVKSLSAGRGIDRKSTRLNSSHGYISYAVFCLKKKKRNKRPKRKTRSLNQSRKHSSLTVPGG